jgi:hypothetical protein
MLAIVAKVSGSLIAKLVSLREKVSMSNGVSIMIARAAQDGARTSQDQVLDPDRRPLRALFLALANRKVSFTEVLFSRKVKSSVSLFWLILVIVVSC